MIKALFFDLDGTLLDSRKEISPYTREILHKCRERGIKLFLATARPPLLNKMLSWDDSTLTIFDGGLYYNGGCTIHGKHKSYETISVDTVQKIVNNVCRYDSVNIALQLEDEKHAFRYPLEDKGYLSWGVSAAEALSLGQTDGMRTVKALVFYANLIDSQTPIDSGLADSLESLCIGNAQYYLTDNAKCVQIMARNVTKAISIKKLIAVLGFDRSEIVVFGDDANDVEMLRECGIGVAVGNAIDEAKAIADHICDTNDNDGIAKWIKENVL